MNKDNINNIDELNILRQNLGYTEDELQKLLLVLAEGQKVNIPADEIPPFPESANFNLRREIYGCLIEFRRLIESPLPQLKEFAHSHITTPGLQSREHYENDDVKRDIWGSVGETEIKYYGAIRLIEMAQVGKVDIERVRSAAVLFEEALGKCKKLAKKHHIPNKYLNNQRVARFKGVNARKINLYNPKDWVIIYNVCKPFAACKVSAVFLYKKIAARFQCDERTVKTNMEKYFRINHGEGTASERIKNKAKEIYSSYNKQ